MREQDKYYWDGVTSHYDGSDPNDFKYFEPAVIEDDKISSASTYSSEKIMELITEKGFTIKVVDELPETGENNTIYFVPCEESGETDVYEEYIWVDGKYEKIGTTKVNLDDYYTKEETNTLLDSKQNVLSAGTNIEISANTISAKGYEFNGDTNGGFAEKYKQDAGDGGQVVANTATGLGSHAEGYGTTASGDYGAHSEGFETSASMDSAHAEGFRTTASGDYGAHSEGSWTSAIGNSAHAEGYGTRNNPNQALGIGSHAEGVGIQALGIGSHAEGIGRIAQNEAEHAEGIFGVSHKSSDNFGDAGNTIHSIGNSYSKNNFHNAVEVMQNGDVYITGVGGYDGVHIKTETGYENTKTVQDTISAIETDLVTIINSI